MARPDRLRLTLFADHGQIHVCDPERVGDLEAAWTARASDDRIADGGDIIGIGTADSDDVAVDVERLEGPPAVDVDAWDHVTESSLDVVSGKVAVLGCSDDLRRAKRIDAPQNLWRVRVSHRGLGSDRENIRIQLWPAPRTEPRVLKRYEAPKSTSIASAPATPAQAVEAARHGETDAALRVLLLHAEAGERDAAISAIQLLAFRGGWRELVPAAMTVIAAEPKSNAEELVCLDACDLLRLASKILGEPAVLDAAAKRLPNAVRTDGEARLFHGPKDAIDRLPPPEAQQKFDAHAASPKTAKRYAGQPQKLAAHLFAVAIAYGLDDELLGRWDPCNESLGFDEACEVARVLVRRGNEKRAWEALESRLDRWWPLMILDVAPVRLLVDPELSSLLTPARCELVLSTKRGDVV